MNTTLGDVLLAGLAKDPESVGRIVAQAIDQAETPIAAATAPETEAAAKPDAKGEPKPDAEAKAPPDSTPNTVK
jgi:hypothetical protein